MGHSKRHGGKRSTKTKGKTMKQPNVGTQKTIPPPVNELFYQPPNTTVAEMKAVYEKYKLFIEFPGHVVIIAADGEPIDAEILEIRERWMYTFTCGQNMTFFFLRDLLYL